jgi:hypothetical protein
MRDMSPLHDPARYFAGKIAAPDIIQAQSQPGSPTDGISP